MKRAFAILGMVFISVSGALAQEHPANARLLTSSYFTLAPASDAPTLTPPLAVAPGTLAAQPGASATASAGSFASAANATPAATPADPQGVQGVYVNYNWQAYFGYTFLRFYEVPGIEQNTNGFNYSMVYYLKSWLGLDGEFAATRTAQSGIDGWLLFGGGGPRFRWSGPRGIELWGHALVGYSHLTPQTPFGTQGAFAYEAGGGADVNVLRSRWALRVGADMVGTHYFGTYQYSPKAFAGIVYKF
ncbi:MAG: hypothetical protein ACRD5M_02100 [Candidatus Acidiferrales bacterium]